MSSQYVYATTNTITGQLLASSLPITAQNMTRTISMAGTFTGYLTLAQTVATEVLNTWIGAVEPYKSVLWCLQDGQPIWNGPVTGWPHQSILDGTLPLTAGTMEAIFQARQIQDTLTFTDQDVFTIFRALAQYAMGQEYGQIAGLVLGSSLSGITDTVTFDGSQLQKVYDAWTWMVSAYDIEYSFRPGITPGGTLLTYLDLGYPQLGRPLAATGLQMLFPSTRVFDYAYPRVAQAGPANDVVATAATSTTTYTSHAPHGQVTSELEDGYPLLQDSISLTGMTEASQALTNALADETAAQESISAMATPVVKLGADATPKVSQVELGDGMEFAATSVLHPARPGSNAPGLQVTGRISSWTLYPPGDQQTEATWYTLGQVEAA